MRKMIEVGSKEEIELLLALFGSHAQPPKKKSRWLRVANATLEKYRFL